MVYPVEQWPVLQKFYDHNFTIVMTVWLYDQYYKAVSNDRKHAQPLLVLLI